MKKKLIAILTVLALTVCLSAQIVAAATPATYQVGYAKVDINPYKDTNGNGVVDEADVAAQKLMALPMGGFSHVRDRLSEENKIDDNGDGLINRNDGLFATCVAVTDQNGNTALIYGIDLLGAYADIVNAVRQRLFDDETLADCGLAEERIFITGSHTHMAPSINAAYNKEEPYGNDYKIYMVWLTDQMVLAARQALADRAAAKMYKGTIDASESQAAKSDIGDTLNSLRTSGKVTVLKAKNYPNREYNSVRHYQITEKEQKKSGSKYTDTGKSVTYVAGNAFNGDYRGVGATRTTDDGSKKYTITSVKQVSQADDKLHIVEYRFEDTSRKSVVLVRWSGHLPNTTSVSDDKEANIAAGKYAGFGDSDRNTSYFQASSTMVNSLRYTLEKNGYRACYLQGTSGNVNVNNRLAPGNWLRYESKSDRTHVKNRHNIYGTELAEVALECLTTKMTLCNQNGGDIQGIYKVYQSERKTITPFEYMAARRYKIAGYSDNRIYKDMYYYEDADGTPLIDDKGQPIETDVNGLKKVTQQTAIVITSVYHANTNINSYAKNGTAGPDVHLYALTIGDDFSMVTASGELFDRYSRSGSLTENMWDDLGADFVVGYTNGAAGYFGSAATFEFSKGIEEYGYAQGSYETMSNSFAPGIGENLVDELDIMLNFLKNGKTEINPREDVCQHCQKYVTWKELTQDGEMSISTTLREGHYYLAKDITLEDKQSAVGATVCLDLRGHTLTIKKSFEVMAESDVSILDSVGNGRVIGCEAGQDGGAFAVKANGTLNQYGGTWSYEGKLVSGNYGSGGVVYVAGDFNMYDGLILGGEVNWVGGAMHIDRSGKASFYGGKITEGKATYASCIGCYGKVQLSGDADITRLYFMGEEWKNGESLLFKGKFTGTVTFHGPNENLDIGDNFDADIFSANIWWTSGTNPVAWMVCLEGNDVYVRESVKYVAISLSGEYSYTNDFQEALKKAGAGGKIALRQDATESITINSDVHVELNGHHMDYVLIEEGKTLQVTDSKAADYDTADGAYGTIRLNPLSKGTLQGKPATQNNDTFVKVAESTYTYSFHAIDLNIDAISLKPESLGVYYRHEFVGDERITANVVAYGVALSVTKAPEEADLIALTDAQAENGIVMGGDVVLTRFTDGFGSNTSTSVLVKNIMKETATFYTNRHNASMPIYGRAYVLLADGTYVLGVTRQLSLQQMVEKMDAQWEKFDPQTKEIVVGLYQNKVYNRVMQGWNIPNISASK